MIFKIISFCKIFFTIATRIWFHVMMILTVHAQHSTMHKMSYPDSTDILAPYLGMTFERQFYYMIFDEYKALVLRQNLLTIVTRIRVRRISFLACRATCPHLSNVIFGHNKHLSSLFKNNILDVSVMDLS